MREHASRQSHAWFRLSIDPTETVGGWWALDLSIGTDQDSSKHCVFVWTDSLGGIGFSETDEIDPFRPLSHYDRLFSNIDEVIDYVWPSAARIVHES